MKKVLSIMVAAGVITALSVSAFAAEERPGFSGSSPAKAETPLTEIAGGLDPYAIVEDKWGDEESAHSVILPSEFSEEYVAELGDGLSITDTVKDPLG